MPKNSDSTSTANIIHALTWGGLMTLATAPVINLFNCASVMGSRYNLTGKALFNKIYSGDLPIHQSNGASYWNFFAGVRPHLVKEFSRIGFKAPGLAIYMPWLQTQYSPHVATQIYAISMSMAEVAINPADTWRVVRQSGDPLVKSITHLYKGALLNGLRQYGIWASVGYNNMLFDPVLEYYQIDPYGPLGIAIKAHPQAAINVGCVYPIERVKNELQFGTLPQKSGLRDAIAHIYQTQGVVGFFRGFVIKTPGAAVQHAAALTLMAWGKRRIDKDAEQEQQSIMSTAQGKS
jgi:hypothetical protein